MMLRKQVTPGAFWNAYAKKVSWSGQRGWNVISTSPLSSLAISGGHAAQLQKIYAKSEIVFACIREKATAAVDAELVVCRDTEDGVEVLNGHESLEMFYNNKTYSFADIVGLLIQRLELTGAAFALMGKYANRQGVGEFVPVPTNVVNCISRATEIDHYEIMRDGQPPINVDPSEIFDVRYQDPGTYLGYVSPLATAYKQYAIDEEREKLTQEVMRNRQVPGLIVEQGGDRALTADQVKVLRDTLSASIGGDNSSRGKSIMLPFGVKVAAGLDVKDIDFSALSALTESRICMAFQVPPILIGAKIGLDASTYSNYEQARKSFYRETIRPLWAILADAFTRNIFRKHGEQDLYFRFETDHIPELHEDQSAKSLRVCQQYQFGIISRDEARDALGYAVDTEDIFALQEPKPATNPEEVDVAPDIAGDQKTMIGKARAAGSFPGENKLRDVVAAQFRREGKAAIEYVKAGKAIDYEKIHEPFAAAVAPILEKIYIDVAMKNWKKVIARAKRLSGLVAKADAVPGAFDVMNLFVRRAIENQVMQLSASTLEFTRLSTEAALARTREALATEMVSGVNTLPALTKAVQREFEDMESWRALRIAATESSRASNDGLIVSAAETGLVRGFRPLVSADACPLCQTYGPGNNPTGSPLYGFTSMADASKQVGEYDGRTLPPYHPHCRCSTEEVLIGEQ